jgi:hypothetical protein
LTADKNVSKLLREAHMVTINGRIEASRLGQAGAGFAALVGRLNDLIRQITTAAGDISAAAAENRTMLEQLERSEQHLREQLVQSESANRESTPSPAKREPAKHTGGSEKGLGGATKVAKANPTNKKTALHSRRDAA